MRRGKLLGIGAAKIGLILLTLAPGMMAQQESTGPSVGPQFGPATPDGTHYIPPSSKPQAGMFAHTNYSLRSPDGAKPAAMRAPASVGLVAPTVATQDEAGNLVATHQIAETPASLGCIYLRNPSIPGCVPNYAAGTGGPSAAGYGAIAIVDAFDNPNAASDLATFNAYWGLPAPPSFTKVIANNGCGTPPFNAGWALEISLDIEWAHVFAPNAAIVLVEACSNSYT